jgi:hypothetical protein
VKIKNHEEFITKLLAPLVRVRYVMTHISPDVVFFLFSPHKSVQFVLEGKSSENQFESIAMRIDV